MNIFFFKFSTLLYLLGALAYSAYIISLKEYLSKAALTVTLIGFASHTLALVARYAVAGYTPVTNLYESLSFFAWMIVGVLLVVNLKFKIKVVSLSDCRHPHVLCLCVTQGNRPPGARLEEFLASLPHPLRLFRGRLLCPGLLLRRHVPGPGASA